MGRESAEMTPHLGNNRAGDGFFPAVGRILKRGRPHHQYHCCFIQAHNRVSHHRRLNLKGLLKGVMYHKALWNHKRMLQMFPMFVNKRIKVCGLRKNLNSPGILNETTQ